MELTSAQKLTLKNAILAEPAVAAFVAAGDDGSIAAYYNESDSPAYWVWRTNVSLTEVTDLPSQDATVFSWTALIARSVQEILVWQDMFKNGYVNPSKDNIRQGFADIFSGNQNSAPAQRTHLLTVARRLATRAERLFATGTGSTGSPGTMAVEGNLTPSDVGYALRG